MRDEQTNTQYVKIELLSQMVQIFSHQVAPPALFSELATRLRHLHCNAVLPWFALLSLSVRVALVSSIASVTTVNSQKGVSLNLRLRVPGGPKCVLTIIPAKSDQLETVGTKAGPLVRSEAFLPVRVCLRPKGPF